MHSFRHTVASRALLAGESVDEIAFLLGHRDAYVTRAVYVARSRTPGDSRCAGRGWWQSSAPRFGSPLVQATRGFYLRERAVVYRRQPASRARRRRDPPLARREAVGMLTKDLLDRIGEDLDGASRAGPGRRD